MGFHFVARAAKFARNGGGALVQKAERVKMIVRVPTIRDPILVITDPYESYSRFLATLHHRFGMQDKKEHPNPHLDQEGGVRGSQELQPPMQITYPKHIDSKCSCFKPIVTIL
jgi:hypothetical protein